MRSETLRLSKHIQVNACQELCNFQSRGGKNEQHRAGLRSQSSRIPPLQFQSTRRGHVISFLVLRPAFKYSVGLYLELLSFSLTFSSSPPIFFHESSAFRHHHPIYLNPLCHGSIYHTKICPYQENHKMNRSSRRCHTFGPQFFEPDGRDSPQTPIQHSVLLRILCLKVRAWTAFSIASLLRSFDSPNPPSCFNLVAMTLKFEVVFSKIVRA